MAEFMKTVFRAVRRICIIGLAVCILYKFCSTTIAADFDPLWYAEQNPDVVAELGDSPELLQLHYELFGKTECRMSNSTDVEAKLRKLFNAEEYAVLYPDVAEAFGDDPDILFEHYVAYGILESRKASEKMSPATVASLKAAVTSALESIGAEAVPGSVAIIVVMEGALTEDAAVQNAFVQVQDALVEAVETTIEEANRPEPAVTESDDDSDSNSGSSSSSDYDSDSNSESSSSSDCGSSWVDPCSGGHKWVRMEDYYGYHKCSVCPNMEEHNWENIGDKHRCTVCGYEKEHFTGTEENKCAACNANMSESEQNTTTPEAEDEVTSDENTNTSGNGTTENVEETSNNSNSASTDNTASE